jgi:uncharacterized protein YndB with AHSA1/START domain
MNPTDAKPHRLEITTTGDREIVMTRILDASPKPVFDAFTKPELISRWLLGPDGWSMPVCEVDLRVGGAFHYLWRNQTDGREFGMRGVYREIVPLERLAHVERFDDPSMPGEAQVTTTFLARDGSTKVTMAILYPSREVRDMALESGMDRGVAASYNRLADMLGSSGA